MKTLSDGGYAISDRIEIDGEGADVFVFGRGWLLEVVDIERGEYCFTSNGQMVRPQSAHFGVYYPSFSLVKPFVKDVSGWVKGVGAMSVAKGLPDGPVLFETDFEGNFTTVDQATEVIASARNVLPIAFSTAPSLLTLNCKRLIDDNYLVFPSIARIADRLGVSHEHMTRQFKRDLGMSPSAYLHHLRVAEATFRLSLGEQIIDISMDVGYNDLSRFYKQFRKKTATSPGECRTVLQR